MLSQRAELDKISACLKWVAGEYISFQGRKIWLEIFAHKAPKDNIAVQRHVDAVDP